MALRARLALGFCTFYSACSVYDQSALTDTFDGRDAGTSADSGSGASAGATSGEGGTSGAGSAGTAGFSGAGGAHGGGVGSDASGGGGGGDAGPGPGGRGGTSAMGGTGGTGSAGSTAGSDAGASGASGSGGAGGVGMGGAGGSAGGAAGSDAGEAGPTEPAPLPFIVDTLFVASGFMGNAPNVGAVITQDGTTCASTRPAGALGQCHKFVYTPHTPTTAVVPWAGLYWQYPVNNWGNLGPGKRIAAGATKVSFYAVGAKGGEVVTFFVGGMTGTVYADSLPKVSMQQVLTTTMTRYSIPIQGYTYDAVLGGFAWTVEATVTGDAGTSDATTSDASSAGSIGFTVDDIRWE